MGMKRTPHFRVVVINSREKREGRPIEELGYYNPKTKEMKLNKESALEWIKKGAQPSETVQYLINNCNEDGTLNYTKKSAEKISKKAHQAPGAKGSRPSERSSRALMAKGSGAKAGFPLK